MKQTPLTAKHRALGGRMIEYAGFEMPVQYTGLVDEHLTVRSKVGIFDLTHMGELELTGPGALATVNFLAATLPACCKLGRSSTPASPMSGAESLTTFSFTAQSRAFCSW